jgi:hypothetical protein
MGTIFSGTLWRMADQREEAVSKGAHCAWQIHYPIVFPVKCRKTLLDEAVTTIIGRRQRNGFRLRWKRLGRTSTTSICSAVRIRKWLRPDCADIQEHYGAGIFAENLRCPQAQQWFGGSAMEA